jgi:hypothetical protein
MPFGHPYGAFGKTSSNRFGGEVREALTVLRLKIRLGRLHPAQIAYGGADGRDEERGAWEASIAAGRPSSTRQRCMPVGRRSGGSASFAASKF